MKPESLYKFFSGKWIFIYLFIAIGVSVLLFFLMGGTCSSQLGDTFGIAGALLTGFALFSLSLTARQLNDAKKDQTQLIENQQQQLAKLQGQVDALGAIAQALVDPVVVARVELSRNTLYSLVIENVGKTSAYNLQFDVEPKTDLYFSDEVDLNVADLPLIQNGLPMLAPSQKIAALVIDGTDRENRKKKGVEFPERMQIKVDYEIKRIRNDGSSQYIPCSFTYHFSFASQVNTFQHRGEVADELNLIYELLKERIKKQ